MPYRITVTVGDDEDHDNEAETFADYLLGEIAYQAENYRDADVHYTLEAKRLEHWRTLL